MKTITQHLLDLPKRTEEQKRKYFFLVVNPSTAMVYGVCSLVFRDMADFKPILEKHPDFLGWPVVVEYLSPEELAAINPRKLPWPTVEEARNRQFGEKLLESMRVNEELTKCDNLKLYWLFHHAILPWLGQQDSMGITFDIINEIENRFIPEYDGETINMTDTGWNTPEGPINYI